MPSDADILRAGKQNVADDDEIVAGEQKMSLKCPVSPIDTDCNEGISFSWHIVELRPYQAPCSIEEMRPSPMFRCNVMVQHDGADDNVALSHL
jgi:hypothetical protein